MNIYGICNKLKSVNTKKGFMISRADAFNNYILNSKYNLRTGGIYRGYIEVGYAYIAPYNGRYGKGFAIAVHSYYKGKSSSKFMQIYFCTEKGEWKDVKIWKRSVYNVVNNGGYYHRWYHYYHVEGII